MLVPETLFHRFPARSLPADFERLFRDLWNGASSIEALGGRASSPAVDVWEQDDFLNAEVELPGLSLEDIEVLVKGRELTLRGTRQSTAPEGAAYLRRERASGSFERVIHLPFEVYAAGVEARFENGVLVIRLPKAEAAKVRRIEIQTKS